jgi:amino-acid N-acetyltransferase
VNSLSHDGTLLHRAFGEICENVRDFYVAETSTEEFCGCGALHIYGPHLAEVRSIVVVPEAQASGTGGLLLHALMEEADEHGIPSVCCFTRIPEFFHRHGFEIAEREAIPDKIRKDCVVCPRFHACDEVAMVRGPLPSLSLAEYESEPALVQLML